MTPHIPKELCTRIDWSPFAIMGHTMPPETLMKRTRTKRTTTKKTTRRSPVRLHEADSEGMEWDGVRRLQVALRPRE
jgi:hypothetical protein